MQAACIETDSDDLIADGLRSFVSDREFPCVGAKSALARGTLEILVCHDMTSAWDDLRIHDALLGWAEAYRADPDGLRSLAVVYRNDHGLDESTFEKHLWARIQSISDKDAWRGQPYDERVSPDPDDPHFSLSFGGEAFFVVGLHPNASRPARRAPHPTMVFNLHNQFEKLREEGRYERMREAILNRDKALAGDINPMLARHGDASEAAQYSGRHVDDAWRCPFSDTRAS